MKKLVFAALVTGVGLAGCTPVDRDPPPVDGSGEVDVVWELTEGFEDEFTSDCGLLGSDLADVVAEDSFGDQFSAPFPCIDGGGIMTDLFPDDYDVFVEFVAPNDDIVAVSFSQPASVFDLTTTEIDPFFVATDGGYLGVRWDLEDANGQVSCAEVGAAGLEIQVIDLAGQLPDDFQIFPCEGPDGDREVLVSGKVLFGGYDILVRLLDDADQPLSLDSENLGVTMDFPNSVIQLRDIIFEF